MYHPEDGVGRGWRVVEWAHCLWTEHQVASVSLSKGSHFYFMLASENGFLDICDL